MLLYGLHVATLSMLISSPLLHWRFQIAGRYKHRHPITHFKRVIVPIDIVNITDRFQGTRILKYPITLDKNSDFMHVGNG